ncbi:hypothetical protein AB0O07_27310 [Streptomyces sp. NPDC093085]|uniref:hypothetical protein n=1 Tax=Streptomyces sp. NPDC093085 TaxID=3155068 RepID=UPI00344533A5
MLFGGERLGRLIGQEGARGEVVVGGHQPGHCGGEPQRGEELRGGHRTSGDTRLGLAVRDVQDPLL